MSHYTLLYKYDKRSHEFLERSYFALVFYILGAFLIKQLFLSHLLDMRWLQPARHNTPHWLSIVSHIQCALVEDGETLFVINFSSFRAKIITEVHYF